MLSSFLITFREGLEAALLIGIMVAYLSKIDQGEFNKYIYVGAAVAIGASGLLGWLFFSAATSLGETQQEIFEGVASLSAALVLTYVIVWMARSSHLIKDRIEQRIDTTLSRGKLFGLVTVAFLAVFREGVETVLLVGTLAVRSPYRTVIGFGIGLFVVLALAVLAFRGVYLLDLEIFFKTTSVILVVFAAGLVAYGVHELNEVGLIPPVIEHLWNTNFLINEDGVFGSILTALIGYNANPSLTEVLAYVFYWVSAGSFLLTTVFKPLGKAKSSEA
ncbi:MAG: FTR1 family protein [Candidatus Bipolaricaulota bacterium]|nr:FTR1 family protein [Candidatus Bipolaricaulota bacterium]